MKRWIALALLACATLAHAQSTTKKDLVAKLLQLQQPGIESMAQALAERPVMQLMQQADNALRTQVPPDKREATANAMKADAQKFVDEAAKLLRDRAVKLAPATVGAVMEEKLSEDELKALIAWHESPVKKKYEQLGPELQKGLMDKLLADAGPMLDPKLQALQQQMGNTLRAAAGAASAPAPAPKASKPAASAAKPAAKAASK